jgi:predicted transposase YbfD/YdcC
MTPTFAWTDELNRSRRERRQIHTQAATPEFACFPHVEQIAQLYRHIGNHKPETVHLITSRPSSRLNAAQWLDAVRQYWGIEGGLHQRLDASLNEDQCRVRNRNAVWVLGMLRRLAVSLFAEWRSRDERRHRATMTDFQSHMSAEHATPAMRFITARYPSFGNRS